MNGFMPNANDALDTFLDQFINGARTYTQALEIPPATLTDFEGLAGAFKDANAKCKTATATKIDRADRDTKKEAARHECSRIKTAYIDGAKPGVVTDAILAAFGLKPHKHPAPIPVPESVPLLIIKLSEERQIVVEFRDKESVRHGKPKNVHGIEVRWDFFDTIPENFKKMLLNSEFATENPLVIHFEEGDRGKHVVLTGRWEIERGGEKGDFGPPVIAIVP